MQKPLLTLFIIVLVKIVQAQIQPVTLTANLKVPAPIFLYDYSVIGSNSFRVTSVFNDLNETGRDVYFRAISLYFTEEYKQEIKIEASDFTYTTNIKNLNNKE